MDSKKYEQMKNFVNSRESNTDNFMVNSLMEFAKELTEKNVALKAELDNQKYMEELYRVSKITKVIALPNPSFIRIKNKNIEFIGDYYIVENERLEKGNFGKISKVRER